VVLLAGFAQAQNVTLPSSGNSLTISSGTAAYTGTAITGAGNNTTVTINGTANVSFTATSQITLLPGFHATAASGATFLAQIQPLIQITITSAPSGMALTVDGNACTAPCTFLWVQASTHSIAAASQAGTTGTQYLFASWSDGGAPSHNVAPSTAATYTANFTTQYYLTTQAVPGTEGSVSQSGSGWYNSGAQATATATPASGNQFMGFSGALGGTTASQTLTMTAPATVTANFFATSSPGSTWFSGSSSGSAVTGSWTNRKKMTVAHSQVASTLANLPVVFSLTDPNLMAVNNGGFVGRADGSDILFTASDGATQLNHEIETYNPATGQLIAWVQVSFLTPAQDAVIYMYYGNPLSPTQQNPTGAWDANYHGVWHLPDGTTLNTADSTTGATASPYGVVAGTGKLGGGANILGGTSFLRYTGLTAASLDGLAGTGQDKTVSLWVNPNNYGFGLAGLVDKSFDDSTGYGGWGLWLQSSGKAKWWSAHGLDLNDTGGATIPANAWTHLTVTWSASSKTASFYVNGVLNSTQQNSAIVEQSSSGQPLVLGALHNGGASSFPGMIDEVEVSNSVRPAAWIQTEYNNQASPSSFLTEGSQEYLNPPAPLTMSYNYLPGAYYGKPYSWTLIPTGGIPPYTWTVGQLPYGMTASSTGVLSGTPLSGYSYPQPVYIPASVKDRAGTQLALSFSLYVQSSGSNPASVSCTASPNPASPGQTVTFSAIAAGGSGSYSYVWSGPVTGTGTTASFTPTAAGAYASVVTLAGVSASGSCAVSVQAQSPPLMITTSTAPLTSTAVGSNYSAALAATGGNPPYSWSVQSGSLPPGVNLSLSGFLTGVPSGSASTYSFTARVADANGASQNQALTLPVNSPLTITTSALPRGQSGRYYSQKLNASGGKPPYRWVVASGSLPPGITLDSSGTLSGVAAQPMAASFLPGVFDSDGNQATFGSTLGIDPGPIPDPNYECGIDALYWADAIYILQDGTTFAFYQLLVEAPEAPDWWVEFLGDYTNLTTPSGGSWPEHNYVCSAANNYPGCGWGNASLTLPPYTRYLFQLGFGNYQTHYIAN
jgi:hypothetical protein